MPAKYQPLIRTEKHVLACRAAEHADLKRTVVVYRKLVRALAGVIFVHFTDIPKDCTRMGAIERLFHKTADNPSPRYEVIDRMFAKFPSYLRRAAIEAAFGAVSSFLSNYARWHPVAARINPLNVQGLRSPLLKLNYELPSSEVLQV